jgi:hypothetical protein
MALCSFKVKLKVSACSEMALTGNPRSKVWVAPLGSGLLPLMAGNKQLVHWTSETWYSIRVKLQELHSAPPPPP